MPFDLLNGFIRWLKKIFHIHPKSEYEKNEVLREKKPEEISIKIIPEEKHGEVSPEEEKPVDVHLPEEKTNDTAKIEEKSPEPVKPPKKKSRTENRKEELSTDKRKIPSHEQRKTIHFGNIKRQSLTGTQRKSAGDENIEKETDNTVPKEREFATTVESPYVEINLDNAEVYLILPKQEFKANTIDETPQHTSYSIDLNGKHQEVIVRITTNRDGLMFVEEERILLAESLVKFQVAFPDVIQGGEYNYNHNDKGLYAFVAIGNNRGRMYYLYNKDRNINALPKRDVWILLGGDFELQTEPDVIEEKWIWGGYQPFRIDLSEIDALVIKNRISGEEKVLALQSTFRIEGDQIVVDDFKEECPLFTSKILNIIAPYENPSGWNVWIQHKAVGAQMVSKNWTGADPLALRLPDDLPCKFGEFQIDICQQNTRVSDETLFFRLMPCIELNYPKELIIPHPKLGHTPSTISVKLESDDEWNLKHEEGLEFKLTRRDNIYEIELPPEEDTLRFSIVKTTKPEYICNFQITLPRLKWRSSKQDAWSDRNQQVERKDLVSGETLYLLVRTNDINKYDLIATIETNGQKLQEEKFAPQGMKYLLELNQFYDTIKDNKGEIILKIEIKAKTSDEIFGSVEALCIPALSILDLAYYRDKKQKADFTKEELIFLNQIFDICGKLLCTEDLIKWYEEETISLPVIVKPYVEEVRVKEKYTNEDTLKIQSPIDFSSYKKRDFEEFFKEIEEIILLPMTMDLWFYGYIAIPMIPKTRDALLFYLRFFKRENIRNIFERQTYVKEIVDNNLSELLKQAQVSLDIKEELENFEKDFAKNPDYRRSLFCNDLFYPGNMYYLVEKWRYYKAKDGNLSKMPPNSDEVLLGINAIEKVGTMRFKEYIKHRGALWINLRHRIGFMNFLDVNDREIAERDAYGFFTRFHKERDE